MRRRGEFVERSFAHTLERGGMRRTWLRGRENVHQRYLIHVCGFNLGLLMRTLTGAGTPKGAAEGGDALLFYVPTGDFAAIILIAAASGGGSGELGVLVIAVDPGGV